MIPQFEQKNGINQVECLIESQLYPMSQIISQKITKTPLYQIIQKYTIQDDLIDFLQNPIEKGGLIQCRLYKTHQKITIFLEKESILIMNAIRKSYFRKSYKVFLEGNQKQYLGKVKKKNNKFVILDNGLTKCKAAQLNGIQRKEVANVTFSNIGKQLNDVLVNYITSKDQEYMFNNLKPQQIQGSNKYGLNFYGRASQSSIKNTILPSNDNETIMFIFGKHDDREFSLDFSYPFSPLVAFQIAIAILIQ